MGPLLSLEKAKVKKNVYMFLKKLQINSCPNCMRTLEWITGNIRIIN